MTKKLTTFDPVERLNSNHAIADFMAAAFETDDPAYIAHALGVVARARGMTEIAKQTGLSREQLYRSFSAEGNPTLRSTLAVMRALGIRISARTCVDEKHLPFDVRVPNATTQKAMSELGSGCGKHFDDADALFRDLDI
ncbi:MAG: putative addiction module antidote protein [Gammaproteobacteria bacterium]|nr:putative addiction module antidote protein [Gammaproteobacteria bacterium]MYD75145.1 putative addiction module antidote protein [Gammaproteobacteria bacterium]MYJ53020.1 putative addiction module antidote protein [Gammaproteobacteria bacterium]